MQPRSLMRAMCSALLLLIFSSTAASIIPPLGGVPPSVAPILPASLLADLKLHTVPASTDSHPLTVFSLQSTESSLDDSEKVPILLLHGRTWSSLPVYHCSPSSSSPSDNRSILHSLSSKNFVPYALDFRSFGLTPSDKSGVVTPIGCRDDVCTVLEWIAARHAGAGNKSSKSSSSSGGKRLGGSGRRPILLGWSQGALVAQMVAQYRPGLLSKLILYGSIYDKKVVYPPTPLSDDSSSRAPAPRPINTLAAALEDFTLPNSISDAASAAFGSTALAADPQKASWASLSQFNVLDPSRIRGVPTCLIVGSGDPYTTLENVNDMFGRIPMIGANKSHILAVLGNCDHACHLLDNGRQEFAEIVGFFGKFN